MYNYQNYKYVVRNQLAKAMPRDGYVELRNQRISEAAYAARGKQMYQEYIDDNASCQWYPPSPPKTKEEISAAIKRGNERRRETMEAKKAKEMRILERNKFISELSKQYPDADIRKLRRYAEEMYPDL